MSLNIENLFVKCEIQSKVAELIENYWHNPSQSVQPNWGLPSSFEPVLVKEPKRKVVISPPQDGWIVMVESKQVVDFALAKALSEELDTIVLVIQLFEISGESGYASVLRGQVLESTFGENDDPLGSTREVLKKYKVSFDTILFPEAIKKLSEGWILKQKK